MGIWLIADRGVGADGYVQEQSGLRHIGLNKRGGHVALLGREEA